MENDDGNDGVKTKNISILVVTGDGLHTKHQHQELLDTGFFKKSGNMKFFEIREELA